MKIQKTLSVIIALGALFVCAAQAQDGQGKGRGGRGGFMSPEARVEAIDKAVTLTADQKTKITDLYKKQAEEMRAMFEASKNGGGDRDANRQKMMDSMKATRDQVRALLTDEQKKKFDEMPQPGRGGGDQGGRRKKQQ